MKKRIYTGKDLFKRECSPYVAILGEEAAKVSDGSYYAFDGPFENGPNIIRIEIENGILKDIHV